MKSKILILALAVLFVSCSDLKMRELERKNITSNQLLLENRNKQKQDLTKLIKNLKKDLRNNNSRELDKYFEDNYRNRKILSEIKKIDFSQVNIVNTELKFHKNSASNIIAFIFIDEVKYFSFKYSLKNDVWKIKKIKDGR